MSEPGPDTDIVRAPWTPGQVRAIQAWQAADHVHPLTCETSEHGALTVEAKGLFCDHCGFTQTWVPALTANTFPSDYAGPLPWVNPDAEPPALSPQVTSLISNIAEKVGRSTKLTKTFDPALAADRTAALVIAIRLMEMHLEMVTPGGVGRDSIAWIVAQKRVQVLRDLLEELRASQPAQPDDEPAA